LTAGQANGEPYPSTLYISQGLKNIFSGLDAMNNQQKSISGDTLQTPIQNFLKRKINFLTHIADKVISKAFSMD
jgi:hypothetical protein